MHWFFYFLLTPLNGAGFDLIPIYSPWKVGIGATWRTAPVAPGITIGPIRGHKICCNQSECDQVQMRCNWRTAQVAPGATGGHRRCALAMSACSTGCDLSLIHI